MKNNKQTYGIKKKLTAAVAMLLVATIMLVSTTYAWFTLSTAPEVKGISTAVGANGNLEIALTNPADDLALITTGTSDSMANADQTLTAANVTWGNLVDLSDASYGLDKITLLPSQLNVSGGVLTDTSAVKVPTYGYDGRISEIIKTAGLGYYDSVNGRFAGISDTAAGEALHRGVRAIGTSSTMSPQMAAYKTAKSNVTTYMNSARSKLSTTLTNNGNALVGAMLQKANNDASDEYIDYVKGTLQIVTDMQSANADLGVALLNMVKTWGASQEDGKCPDDSGPVTAENYKPYYDSTQLDSYAKIANYLTTYGFYMDATLRDNLANMMETYVNINTKLTAANTALSDAKTAGTATWTIYSGATENIADLTQLTIDGKNLTALSDEGVEGLMELSQKITAHTAPVVIPAASGGSATAFTKLVGKYDAVVDLTGLRVVIPGTNNFTFTPIAGSTALMNVWAAADSTTVVAALIGVKAPDGFDAGATSVMDDMYGYILDFAIRTNAEDSKLLLQRSRAQRVYSEESNTATQGAGSKMTFTTAPTKGVANAITLVFFIRDSAGVANVKAIGKLDTTGYSPDKMEYEIQLTGNQAPGETNADVLIANMTKNGIYKLSVLVYLDGEDITNADVSATEPVSVSGTLNLQFASSANLVPMENADMHNAEKATPTA